MAGLSALLTKGFRAEAAIVRRRIVRLGAADSGVVSGVASTDLLVGVSTEIDVAIGETADVILAGLGEVEYGGAVPRGSKLTSDGFGRAIVAAPAAGVNAQVVGIAMTTGVLGDIGLVNISPSVMQG